LARRDLRRFAEKWLPRAATGLRDLPLWYMCNLAFSCKLVGSSGIVLALKKEGKFRIFLW
jgi:hypothetical protein